MKQIVACCQLFNGAEIHMLADDLDHVVRIGKEIRALQAQQTLGASMIAQVTQMGRILKDVMPSDIEELVPDQKAAGVLSDIFNAPEPASDYQYTQPNGLPGVLQPTGWALVVTVEAEEWEDE